MSKELFRKLVSCTRLHKRIIAQVVFYFVCVILTIVAVFKCINTFLQDNDVSLVNFKKFNSDKDAVYPSVSLCFGNPFLKEQLVLLGSNVSSYVNFLTGNEWDETLVRIDYDKVTVDISQYVLGYELEHEPY